MKSAFHLVRTMMYVSQPKSLCDKDEIPDKLMDSVNLSHFHINRALHPHNIAVLCTLFPGGIEKLLLEQLGSKNVSSWEKVAKRVPDPWENDILKTEEQEWKTKEKELNSKLQGTRRENKILNRVLQGKRVDRIFSNPWRWNSRVKRLSRPPSAVSQLSCSLANF
ncbi:hypothetical protein TNCV_875271 [Trichonephila clavipes]|nr:hypothetical protein TNCV_875271 [Trichonephila clavipes]